MTRSSTPRSVARSSGSERVFADDLGRLWNAAHSAGDDGGVVVFSCISDSRQPVRCIAVPFELRIADVEEGLLRGWLRDAPKVGRLT